MPCIRILVLRIVLFGYLKAATLFGLHDYCPGGLKMVIVSAGNSLYPTNKNEDDLKTHSRGC